MAQKTTSPELVARRYAAGLFDAAKSLNIIEPIQAELRACTLALMHDPELFRLTTERTRTHADREALLVGLPEKNDVGHIVENFLKILNEGDRVVLIEQIDKAYQELVEKMNGIVVVEATTAAHLSDAEQKQVTDKLIKVVGGAPIRLQSKVDPS